MLDYIIENLGTIVMSSIILAIVGLVIFNLIQQAIGVKAPICSGCASCSLGEKCLQHEEKIHATS